jgi:hypothetical protein
LVGGTPYRRKRTKNRDLQQEILEELKEIKKMMNEMYINQQKKALSI